MTLENLISIINLILWPLIHLISVIIWPVVLLIIFFFSRERIFSLLSEFKEIEFGSSAMKLTLKRLEYEYHIPKTQIKKLKGLTGHDLWALKSFANPNDDTYSLVNKLSPTRKAMAYSFIEMGLLEIVGEGDNRKLSPTKLVFNVFEAADKLL